MSGLVRQAETGDVGDIARLIGQLRSAEDLEGEPDADAVRAYLAEDGVRAFVATDHGAVVGVVTVRTVADLFHGGPSALVQELVIDAGSRGAGHGGALLDAAVDFARSRGCAEIGVSTGADNTAARRLYESRGFEEEGVVLELHLA